MANCNLVAFKTWIVALPFEIRSSTSLNKRDACGRKCSLAMFAVVKSKDDVFFFFFQCGKHEMHDKSMNTWCQSLLLCAVSLIRFIITSSSHPTPIIPSSSSFTNQIKSNQIKSNQIKSNQIKSNFKQHNTTTQTTIIQYNNTIQ